MSSELYDDIISTRGKKPENNSGIKINIRTPVTRHSFTEELKPQGNDKPDGNAEDDLYSFINELNSKSPKQTSENNPKNSQASPMKLSHSQTQKTDQLIGFNPHEPPPVSMSFL